MQAVVNWYRIYFHPKVLAVMLLGFSSGLPRLLVASTLGAMLTEYGIEMAAVGLFAYVALPYSFNFLWAPLVDAIRLPVLGSWLGQRRSWMLLSQILLMLAIAALALVDPSQDPARVALLALLVAFFSASQDITVDAFRTEYLDKSQYGEGAAMAVFGYRLGMLLAGAGVLYFAEYLGWQTAYLIMAAAMVVGMVTTLLVRAPAKAEAAPAQALSLSRLIISPFKDFMARFPAWGWLLGFILFYRLSDGFIGFMTTPFFLQIGFDKPTIAAIAKLFGFGATLAGMFIGGAMIARRGLFTSLWSFALFQLLANSSYLMLSVVGKNEGWLTVAISLDNLSGGMVTAAAIAFMMRLCQNASYTATQCTLLSSLASLGSITLAGTAGWIAQSYGWTAMFGLSALLGLPCLWIFWHKRRIFRELAV